VSPVKQDIGARVDALSQALDGDEFVSAIERLADGMSPDEREALQEVLLERAADEEDLQQAVGRRFAEKGWTRRTLAWIEGLWRDDRAVAIALAIQAGPDGKATLARELEGLRQDRGRAALVLDELSRNGDAAVRAWVPGAAAGGLEDGGSPRLTRQAADRRPHTGVGPRP